jgi:hypothetical protein
MVHGHNFRKAPPPQKEENVRIEKRIKVESYWQHLTSRIENILQEMHNTIEEPDKIRKYF